ncbi:hypothetical protein JOD54_003795 [Actinokineospora baliensis]|uniref:hypothetical protein n=1 Tax=Actinokineospora baliensis TaxID=547056 RepID=UPI0019562D4D|nr:hypothetical protein [Actinokineospora baliensis]MBM7773591.1 hypothetical protein [Actinokineospora baliensis]
MGTYPFGRPALRRAPRLPETDRAAAFVLGVYPGALRVRWHRPGCPPIPALAVDDESPTDAERALDAWRDTVGWRPEWGSVELPDPPDAARLVVNEVLAPLGLDPRAVYATHCVPNYFVKSGDRQANAIAAYDRFASKAGLPPAALHRRPERRELVHLALRREGRNLLRQLKDADAPLVITLGQEAADVFAGLAGMDRVPFRLTGSYGSTHPVPLGARELHWIPLIHPATRRGAGWRNTHARWALERSRVLPSR